MDPRQKKNISTFLRTLRRTIKTRIALSFCCSYLNNEKELIGYFTHLSRLRITEFLQGKIRHPTQGRQLFFFQSRIIHWVKLYKAKMEDLRDSSSLPRFNRWGLIENIVYKEEKSFFFISSLFVFLSSFICLVFLSSLTFSSFFFNLSIYIYMFCLVSLIF